MHGPLVVMPERLVAMCISGHRLPTAFVGEGFLHRLVRILEPWGVQKGFWGMAGFGPVDQGVRGPPVARLVVAAGVRVSSENIL
jgi:hypothetical protein